MLELRSRDGTTHVTDLESAIQHCALFSDLADDLRDDAESGAVTPIEIPAPAPAVAGVAAFINLKSAMPAPLGSAWTDGEVELRFSALVNELLGSGGAAVRLQVIVDTMCAADFVRNERCVTFWANYIAGRLSDASPSEVKQWCGFSGPLTPCEQSAVAAMHRLLLEQKL